jgi:hypothetical protein
VVVVGLPAYRSCCGLVVCLECGSVCVHRLWLTDGRSGGERGSDGLEKTRRNGVIAVKYIVIEKREA